jgi:hypothetical protein
VVLVTTQLLTEISTKKERLLKALLTDAEFVRLVANDDNHPVPGTALRYKQVFPYGWVDETATEAKTFVCFDVDVLSTTKNVSVKNCNIYFWVFSHQKVAMTSKGVRADLIAEQIDTLLNGSPDYGFGNVKLESFLRSAPNANFYGRVLKYSVQDWNRFCSALAR